MPAIASPAWDRVTAAFDGELRAWEIYAAEIRLWTEAMRIRFETGHAPSDEHRRVIGDIAPEAMLEQTEWVAESAERIAARLRDQLASGDIQGAFLTAFNPGLGGKGFDYRAPGFWRGPTEPGDLTALWSVPDRERQDVLRAALYPDAAPEVYLKASQAWARPLLRWLWTPSGGHGTLIDLYSAHLDACGNPWAASGEDEVTA